MLINNREKFIIYLKIFFMHIFFNYRISDVVSELNRSLLSFRKFAGIIRGSRRISSFMSIFKPNMDS